MTRELDIKELLLRESASVEWKEGVADVEDVLKTITAFANDIQNVGGGYIVCGAKETKDVYGFPRAQLTGISASRYKEIEGKIQAGCLKNIFPAITPLSYELPAETPDKKVLVFIVPASKQAHSFRIKGYDGGIHYIRLNNQTLEARNGLLRELFVTKNNMETWDKRLNEKATLSNINTFLLHDTLAEMKMKTDGLENEEYFTTPLSAFVPGLGEKRGLDKKICLKNFALALFGKDPTHFFPGAWTRVSFYPGKDKSERYSNLHDITGGLIEQTRKILSLLEIQQAVLVDKQSPAANITKFPEQALKEAVVNAIVHRNYESDLPTRITVFSDRVEIYSPGALPRIIDKEKFLEGRAPAVWRNQTLAWFFNKLRLSQSEGQGISIIFREMQEHGSPSPEFSFDGEATTCVLRAHPRHTRIDSESLAFNSRLVTTLNEKIKEFHETRLLPKENREKVLTALFAIEKFLESTPLFMEQPSTRGILDEIAKIKKRERELDVFSRENLAVRLVELSKRAMLKAFNF